MHLRNLFKKSKKRHFSLTTKILIGMALGLAVGFIIRAAPQSTFINIYIVNGLFDIVGKIFIELLKMLIVPVVFVALICGTSGLGDCKQLGKLGTKTLLLFIIGNVIAVSIALTLATLFHVGSNSRLTISNNFHIATPQSLKTLLLNIVPTNPINAMANGNLLQIITFAILIGIAISMTGRAGKHIADFFNDLNKVLMKLIDIVMRFAPYGVFCLLGAAFAKIGLNFFNSLLAYFLTILIALIIQLFGVYSLALTCLARLNPITFFKKMYTTMLFAFSSSSSNATIGINLDTTENKLGVNSSITSFIIPLGANINLNGTGIMQGVAAVFIAHVYHVALTLPIYGMIIIMTTITAMSTAGVPSAGILTLAMVLQQAGLPLEGIGLVIGIDRIVDMLRTIINITGDTVTACIVGKSEKKLDLKIYKNENDF